MAGNNSIQILRGNNVKITAPSEVLLDGQPLYDRTTGYLYVGANKTVLNTQAVNAYYANTAGTASSATQANYVKGYLYFNGAYSNGTTYNNSWDGRDTEVLYVPTALGSTGQVWGMVNSNRAGWINQTEIPGTIENANHANTADVAYEVSGSNVRGTVANATNATAAVTAINSNFANFAGRFPSDRLYFNGAYKNGATYNVGWNGFSSEVIYVPTALGNSGQVWGTTSSVSAGWISSVPNANYANFANIANSVESSLNIKVMGTNYTYNGFSNVNTRSRNLVASSYVTPIGAIPYTTTNGSGATPANVAWLSKGITGQVLTATDTAIAWRNPAQLYAMEDLGSKMYIAYSCSFGSTDSIEFIETLYNMGYRTKDNPLRVIYGVRDNRPIRAIYASNYSTTSTRFSIMYLDNGIEFISYNGTSSAPAYLTIHKLSYY